MDDPALIIEGNMRDDEKEKLMERVLTANPNLRGATVADVLEMAHDADAFVEITEELWATQTEGEYDEPWKGEVSVDGLEERDAHNLYAHAMTAIAMVYGAKALDYEQASLRGILHRYTKNDEAG
jgi:hypothetical protein